MSAERECRASISGLCLQLSEGFRLCAESECEIGDYNDAIDRARESAGPPPRRASRKPVRGRPRPLT